MPLLYQKVFDMLLLKYPQVLLDILEDKILLNQKLAEYLIWYNTARPHKSLGLKSPLQYLVENRGMSQKTLTFTSA